MGPPKITMGNVTYLHPFQGQFVVHKLGIATINLCSKFEVSAFTHYKDMKG